MTTAPLARCPDCGTELTYIRQSRSGRRAAWCWKCERYLRLGEQRAAEAATKEVPAPKRDAFVDCGLSLYRGSKRGGSDAV